MSHFYATKAKTPSLVEDVQTPAKAKKIQGMYPSVTTVLGIIVDDFINNIWKPRKITELARPWWYKRDGSRRIYALGRAIPGVDG